MMNQTFTFTLRKEEYLSFLRFQSAHSKHAKGIRMWLRISLPALLVCFIILMQAYEWGWIMAALLLIFLWECFIAPLLWKKYLYRTINEETVRHMNITGFQKVKVTFYDNRIVYKDKKTHEILYQDIIRMIPADDLFIFQYKNQGTLLLPYRLFDEKADVDAFHQAFKTAWKSFH